MLSTLMPSGCKPKIIQGWSPLTCLISTFQGAWRYDDDGDASTETCNVCCFVITPYRYIFLNLQREFVQLNGTTKKCLLQISESKGI